MSFSFNGNTPKSIIFNNQEVKKLIYNNDVVWEKKRLPDEYQEVEYIENTGTQWIDTGNFATDKTKVEVKYKIGVGAAVFGARAKAGGIAYILCDASFYNNKIYLYYGDSFQQSKEDIDNEKAYVATIENGKATISDMTDIQVENTSTFTMNYSMYLFAINERGSASFQKIGTRIYYFKIYENGNLEKNFVPCYRKSDGEAGLYDIINDNFYVNLGTGTFIKGLDVN